MNNSLFFVNGNISETPVFWTAITKKGFVINQINDKGLIDKKWSELSLEDLQYWGVISNVGCYGFNIEKNELNCNGVIIPSDIQLKNLSYKRTIISSSEGWLITKSVTITLGDFALDIYFYPETKVVVREHKNNRLTEKQF